MIKASGLLLWSFVALAAAVAAAFPLLLLAAERRLGAAPPDARRRATVAALAVAAWMALTGLAGASGRLSFETMPPTMPILIVATFAVVAGVVRSEAGRRIAAGAPLALLVGVQAFRLPLEMLMHRAYEEGIMPVQMSYSGLNFDIVTGLSALLLAPLVAAGRAPAWLVRAWNLLGIALLTNILTVALLSAPTPLRVFHNEPANVWVTRAPWVWLVTILVAMAMLGHAVIWRRLARASRAAEGPRGLGHPELNSL